jgi:hypothetical protein
MDLRLKDISGVYASLDMQQIANQYAVCILNWVD